jgi:hypothetical protein
MTSAISERVTSLSGLKEQLSPRDGVAILGTPLAIDETGGGDGEASPPNLATEGAIPLSARGRPPNALLRQHSTQLVQTELAREAAALAALPSEHAAIMRALVRALLRPL